MFDMSAANELVMLNKDVPKIAQKVILQTLKRNKTKYLYVLIHRQYGKTHLAYKIAESFLLKRQPPNPYISITMPTIIQGKAVYLKRFQENLAPFKPVLDDNKILRFSRPHTADRGYVEFFGCDRFSDSDRGRTTVFNICDEYGSFPKGFFQKFIAPFADHYDSPNFLTGTTSQGPNFFKHEFDKAGKEFQKGDKDFFAFKWTIYDSLRTGEISQKKFDKIRKIYDTPEYRHIWLGEYMLDWFAYLKDQIYGQEISNAYDTGRVGFFPHDPMFPVDTFWDIGTNGTAVWFRQNKGNDHIYIGYEENLSKVHFQKFIADKIFPLMHKYNFRYHIFPHDIVNKDFSSPETRLEIARNLLPGNVFPWTKTRNTSPLELIDFARRRFDRCFFDEDGCAQGLIRLQNYVLKNGKPCKTGDEGLNSHGSDAFTLSENSVDFFKLDKYQEDGYREYVGVRRKTSVFKKQSKKWWKI